MLNFIGLAVGILLGLLVAWRRGGNRLDLLHYGTVFGIIGFLLSLVAMLVIPALA